MHRHRVLQKTDSLLLSSSATACILSILLFLAIYINNVYLPDSQLLPCTKIKLFHSHVPPGRVSQLRSFGHVNGVPLTEVQCNVNA